RGAAQAEEERRTVPDPAAVRLHRGRDDRPDGEAAVRGREERMTPGLWELVLKGVWTTVQLLVLSGLLMTAVALVVGVARTNRHWIVRFLAGFYTEVFRGTSALVMIFWVFFVLPVAFGWQLVPMWAGTLALGLTYGAYGSEIVRGALNA